MNNAETAIQSNSFLHRSGSIAVKLIACTFIMFLFLAVIIASISYNMYKKAFYEYGSALCLSSNAQAAYAVDGDLVSRFAKNLTVDAEYERFAERLDKLSGMIKAKYFYILVDKGVPGMYTYIYDATHAQEFPGERYALGRNETVKEYEGADKVLATGRGFAKAEYYNERYGELYYAYAPIRDSSGRVVAFLGTDVDVTPMHEQFTQYRNLLLITLGAALVFSAFMYYLLVKYILTLPLRFITRSAERLARGQLNLQSSGKLAARNDEIGQLADTFEDMGKRIAGVIFDIERIMRAVSAGHMAERADLAAYQGDYHRIISGLNSTLDLVNEHLDALPEAIAFFDADRNLLYGNKAMNGFIARFHLGEKGQDILRELLTLDTDPNLSAEREAALRDLFRSNYAESIATAISPSEPGGEQYNYSIRLLRTESHPLFSKFDNTCVMLVLSDTTQLVRARNEALAAGQAKSDFLSRMSHEIRTPMNAIIGLTQLAYDSGEPDTVKNYLDRVKRASAHLLGVINDILDFSKIEAGKMELDEQEFHLPQNISFVLSMLGAKAEERRISIRGHIESFRHGYVTTDSLRLNQVLINLLSNAVKFSREDGVIDFTVQETGFADGMAEFAFTVRDYGIGMTPSQKERLFSPFEQGDSGIARTYGGTGLGLVISKGIIDAMGGEISFESEEGAGSTFYCSIRVRASQTGVEHSASGSKAEADVRERDFHGLRVLIVDDIDINREILRELLRSSGIMMEEAGNGQSALEMFAASPPGYYDFILMDMQMPVMDGCEATRRIRAMNRPDAASVQIIAMTANVMMEDIRKALAAGMNAHTGKPVELDALFHALETAREHARAASRQSLSSEPGNALV